MRGKTWKLSEDLETVHIKVAAVMTLHGVYPDFGSLLNALMRENGDIPNMALAVRAGYRHSSVYRLVNGDEPTYDAIRALLEKNPLHLPATDGKVDPWCCHVLFAKAGFIEVTPESVAHFNREVLADLARRAERDPDPASLPQWGDVIKKLLHFQAQAESYNKIAERVSRLLPSIGKRPEMTGKRLNGLAANTPSPHPEERCAIERGLGLTKEQRQLLEGFGLRAGNARAPSPFSRKLQEMLETIGEGAMGALSRRSKDPITGEYGITQPVISDLASGKNAPTLESVRRIVRGFKYYLQQGKLTYKALDELIAFSGFGKEEMEMTARDVIARIDSGTNIATLRDLRNAVDINITQRAAADAAEISLTYYRQMETGAGPFLPKHIQSLLDYYDGLLKEQGKDGFTPEERQKIMEVAGRENSLAAKVKQRREPPSPHFTR